MEQVLLAIRGGLVSVAIVASFAACGGGMAGEGQSAGDCNDGADNDGDGQFDCRDTGCTGAPVCQVVPGTDGGMTDGGMQPPLGVDSGSPLLPRVDSGMVEPPPGRANGEACSASSECRSALCYIPPTASTGYCTTTCGNEANCLFLTGDRVCGRPNGQAQDICVLSDIAERCENNSDCIFGSCLYRTPDDLSGYCTRECESFADCPAFWECSMIGSGAGMRCIQSE